MAIFRWHKAPTALALLLLLAPAPRAEEGQRHAAASGAGPKQELEPPAPASGEETEGGEGAGGKGGEGGESGEIAEHAKGTEGGEEGESRESAEGTEGGEEGKGGEEGEGIEEEMPFTETDVSVSAMLLGSVTFVLGLLYLVNWNDDDIRRYSWVVISTTISIFLAVLLFQGLNKVLLMLLEGFSDSTICAMQFAQWLAYVVVLQTVIAFLAGAVCEQGAVNLDMETWIINDPLRCNNGAPVPEAQVRNPHGKRSNMVDEYGMEVPVMKVRLELESRKRRMKCYARLLSHMAGFAAITAGGTMQQLKPFNNSALFCVVPALVVLAVNFLVFKAFGAVRTAHEERAKRAGRTGRRAALWNEEVFEAENDIMSLSVSALVVQAIRFALSDVLPNAEGLEEPEPVHALQECLYLILFGVGFAVVACVIVMVQARRHTARETGEATSSDRLAMVALNMAGMVFAWCTLWGTRWLLFRQPALGLPSIMGRVVMALIVSAVSCLAVFALDIVDDLHQGSEDSKASAQVIQICVNALSVLIGFSWEHAFDGGVAAVASKSHHPEAVEFVLGLLIAFLMTPMWGRHILTKEMSLQKLKFDRKESQAVRRLSDEKLARSCANYQRIFCFS